MHSDCDEVLDAVIRHVQELKEKGVRYLNIAPETLEAFEVSAPPTRRRSVPQAAQNVSTMTPISRPPLVPRDSELVPGSPVPPPHMIAAVQAPVDAEAKEAALAGLRQRALVCQKCAPLARSRKNVVFGVGDIHSPLMFVGEAPGAEEDAQGEPFVGAAGQLLTRIIRAMGFSRETVYIANVLKCRPDTPGQSFGNRKPTPDEMKTCLPYLVAQIELIQPKVIVALGATAVEGLLGLTSGISKLRGNFQSFRGVPVMPTFHPSYLLRNEALGVKRQVWEDMLQVLQRLGVPITEKQRNFFLKSPQS